MILPEDEILDPEFLKKLDRLDIVSRKVFASKFRGDRMSKQKGTSVEFADYRNYAEGDDLRFIDWNIYSRLDRLFLKLFLEEEDLYVSILIDVSESMNFGEPTKFAYARKVAAALAYVGLVNHNRVMLCGFSDDLDATLGPLRSRRKVWEVITFLRGLEPGGGSDLARSFRSFALTTRRKGVVIVISDFLDRHGWKSALGFLSGRKADIYCIHLLSQAETEPELAGELKMVDSEDGTEVEVTPNRFLLNRYRTKLNAFCESVKGDCTRRGIRYVFTTNRAPFEQLILTFLRLKGLLK